MSTLKLFLLGPPRVELDGSPVDIERRKALALLIYLAVSGQPHSRDTLATLYYPDHNQSRARAYLRRDLAILNTSLTGDWLIIDRDIVELRSDDGLWLDVRCFQQCLSACRRHDHVPEIPCEECLPLLTEAVELYANDFLAGFTLRDCPEFDDWQFFQAESLRQQLATALEQLVQGCDHQGDYDTAIPYARRWVALDPLYEPAQRELIQLYDQAGQPAAALRQYEEYVGLLEEELGLPPEEETITLYEAIKAKRILGPFIKVNEHQKEAPAKRKVISPPEPVPQTTVSSSMEHKLPSTDSMSSQTPTKLPGEITGAVGREAELVQLHVILNKALGSRRQLVFVTGEPGLGKTTLIEVFLAGIRETTPPWIGHGQCIEHRGTGEAYMPVLEALGRMCREPEGRELIALLSRVAPTWLVQMPWLISPDELETLQARAVGTTRERMLREMVEAIETLTAQRPLVLVLEDLHWSDYSTLDLLTWLAQRQEPARLLIIGTYRPSDITVDDHPLPDVVQELKIHGQCTELPLTYLTEPAVEAYLERRFSEAALAADLGHFLHQRTGGNPLFMRAVVDSWVAQGLLKKNGKWTLQEDDLEVLAVSVPDDLRRLIEQQLRRLDPEVQKILEAAGVVGMEFSTAAVAAAIDLDEEVIEDRCDSLVQRGQFIRPTGIAEWPDGTVSAQFEFVHHLYQEVLYKRVSAGRQARLHRQIGDRLEAGYSSRASEMANELVVHFVRGHDPHRAVQYLQLAAEHALSRNAPREAVAHLRKGLEILKEHPDLPERAQDELILQATLAPIMITIQGWSSPEAGAAYQRSCELSQQLGDSRQLSYSLYGLASVHELRGEYAQSQALLEQRLQLPDDSQDHGLIIESHELLACSTFHQGLFDQAIDYANRGSSLYEAQQELYMTRFLAEDPGVACHHWAALALWFLGYPEQALDRIAQALDLADNLAHSFSLAQANQRGAMLHQFRREKQIVRQRAETAISIADQRGFFYWGIMGDVLRGWALAIEGEYDEGIAKIRQGLETCMRTGAAIDYPYFLGLLAEAYGYAGRDTEALEAITEALDRVQTSRTFFYEAELHRLKGTLILQTSRTDRMVEAEASFQQALDLARKQQAKLLELRAALCLGRLWQQQGKTDEAREMLEEIYAWFTEGFDTADLQEARALIEELGGEVKVIQPKSAEPQRFAPDREREQQVDLEISPDIHVSQIGGRFEQKTLIATGGMGEVYLGLDHKTGRSVAIKRLKAQIMAQDPEAVKRLIREGEVLHQLDHPNIVKVLTTVECEGQPTIVMEYIPGGSLQDLLEQHPQLPLDRALEISLELADALARVHHLGILHRDLKPANVLLAEDGTPRLTDFGIAYLAQQDTRLTQEGTILGTSVYLSPEAWRGEELDTRSDVWSFGALLYEMLAGQPPFAGEHVAAIMTAILNDPPPDLAQSRPETPPAMVELIKQMLVKERALRIDSMRQVAAGLEMIQRDVS